MAMKTVKAVSILSLLTRYLQQYNIAYKILHFLIRPKFTKISLPYHQFHSRCSGQLYTFVLELQFKTTSFLSGPFVTPDDSLRHILSTEQLNCETVSGEDGSLITTNLNSWSLGVIIYITTSSPPHSPFQHI